MPRPPDTRLRPLRRLATVALALAALPCAAFDLDQLMLAMAQAKSGKATFTERREVRELDRALESSGRLSFAAPDQFVRETLADGLLGRLEDVPVAAGPLAG